MIINVREHRRGNQKWTVQQSRETVNKGHTRRRKNEKTKNNTVCVGHHYRPTNTNNKIPTEKRVQYVLGTWYL
jgi:hypothetical protein